MAPIQYSRITPFPTLSSSSLNKTSLPLLFLLLLILINIQVSSFYTLDGEGTEFGGGEDEKSLNSLDFYAPNLGLGGVGGGSSSFDDPLMPGMGKGHCNTLTSTVHVTKEEKDTSTGLVYRTCEGDITVSKCEGTCNSQLKPSVQSPTGFKKDCMCCRESRMVARDVELTKCFNADGVRITDPMNAAILIKMEEPEGCECRKCGLN